MVRYRPRERGVSGVWAGFYSASERKPDLKWGGKVLKNIFCGLFLVASLIALPVTDADAQQKDSGPTNVPANNSASVTPSHYPPNAGDLDKYLSDGDYLSLNSTVMQARDPNLVYQNMNWEKDKLHAGASSVVAIIYARDIWRLINAKNVGINPQSSHEFEKVALMAMFYAYELTYLDGVKCEDSSAPERRRANLFVQISGVNLAEIWNKFSGLSGDDQKQIILNSIQIEVETSSLRVNDKFLCSGGDAQAKSSDLSAALGSYLGSHDGPIPSSAQIPFTNVSNYQPRFVSKDVWEPKQTSMRDPAFLQGKVILDLINRIRH